MKTTSDLYGSPSKTRTCDKAINSRLLYRLSYQGTVVVSVLGDLLSCCLVIGGQPGNFFPENLYGVGTGNLIQRG